MAIRNVANKFGEFSTYAEFASSGMRVDLHSYFKSKDGAKAARKVAESAFKASPKHQDKESKK